MRLPPPEHCGPQSVPSPRCVHHWLLGPPTEDEVVPGICRDCQATRVFTNARLTLSREQPSRRSAAP